MAGMTHYTALRLWDRQVGKHAARQRLSVTVDSVLIRSIFTRDTYGN
jgi:hypothetical protein